MTVVDAIHHAYWDAEAEGRDPVAASVQVLEDHFAVQNALRRQAGPRSANPLGLKQRAAGPQVEGGKRGSLPQWVR